MWINELRLQQCNVQGKQQKLNTEQRKRLNSIVFNAVKLICPNDAIRYQMTIHILGPSENSNQQNCSLHASNVICETKACFDNLTLPIINSSKAEHSMLYPVNPLPA